ncbi:MAG: MoxR family ATPase [Gemmataceae bacterium]|nr:MoxR family ATPase [Gemmataceae bacterium]MCI0740025.1 MoxR family ATPase [Gemmataceae bacterium]
MTAPLPIQERANQFRHEYEQVFQEISKVIVGSHDIIHGVLTCLFVGGHALLEGVPGLGKTLLIRTLSQVLDLKFNRIQFTPDLMPSDIMGTNIINEADDGKRIFTFQPGPLFAQIVLADEINRATPKTQSALLEAMQEHSVTIGGTIHRLEEPFFVMATQNPLEQEGTYPLPEAQLDRFFFKLLVNYSTREEMGVILDRTTKGEFPQPGKVMDGARIREWQALIREVLVAPPVQDFAIRLILATHPGGDFAAGVTNKFIRCGGSPRGAQALVLAGKVRALLEGRYNVSFDDIRRVYLPALRHRILLNFEAQAENIPPDNVLADVLNEVKEKPPETGGRS